ncbi:MAG TPA: M3 family metallopeptidase [Pyrinomonadaceae bacterium]|jgi:oligoendopeptidase F
MAALLLSLLLFQPVLPQEKFEPIPKEIASQYKVDFARNFFPSPEAEKEDRLRLSRELKDLESLKGRVTDSADNLLRALELYDAAQVRFQRHDAYLYLRYAVNLKDEASFTEEAALAAEFTRRTSFLQQELMQIEDLALTRFVAQKPPLKAYLFAIESARRYRPHTLRLEEEELLSATAPDAAGWQYELYQHLISRTPFGTVRTRDGNELDVRKQRNAIANSPERAVREAGWKKRFAAFASQRDLYAFTLLRLARARNRLARLHHYEDAPDEAYFSRYWTKREVKDLFERIHRRADLYKRYQRLRAAYVKKINGYEDVNVWDMTATSTAGMQPPRFTITQASRIIREALAPLGLDYGRELSRLLDPAERRLDIVSGDNRLAGGFSLGFPGTQSVFYSSGFEGYYNDLRVLTHESTHAVHRQLMGTGNVLPAYATGPSYLFESFAIFNEFLLPDYLYKHETDPARKRYFLEQFLEGKGMVIFVVAPEATLEQAIYDRIEQPGSIKSADDLDALTKSIYSPYSIWADKHDELKMQWMTQSLFYQDPLYDINYIYGALLALKFYELYTRDPQSFIPRYIALMRHGFDAPPSQLLKRFLDIDLSDPSLVTDAMSLLETKVKLLEESYSK